MENIVDSDYVNKPNALENNEMATMNKGNNNFRKSKQ